MATTISRLEEGGATILADPSAYGAVIRLTRSQAKAPRAIHFERILTPIELFADCIAVFLTLVLTYLAGFGPASASLHTRADVLCIAGAIAVIFVLMLDREGAYRPANSLLRVKETERVLRVCVQLLILTFLGSFIAHLPFQLGALLATAVFLSFGLIAEKQLIYTAVRALHARGVGVRRVVIYGGGYTGRRVFSALVRSPKLGLHPVIVVDDNQALEGTRIFESSYRRERSIPVVQGPLTKDLLQEQDANLLVIAIPSLSRERFFLAVNEAVSASADIAFVPGHFVPSDLWIEHANVDGLLVASIEPPPERTLYNVFKRAFDVVVGTAILILVSPLFAIMALLIRLDSKGPAIFVQNRVGKDGRRFDLFKFRTMYVDAPAYHYSPVEHSDPRITRVGRFLRRTSLDELPQVLNVIRGEMSLVGPRPEMPFIVEQYLPRHRQRLRVKPGITGLWQLSADRAFLIHENIEYDLYYIRNRNFFMDIAILLHTVVFAMRGV